MTGAPGQRGRALDDPDRLADLGRTDLLDSSVEEAFERCTRLVTRLLGVPVALVSLVDDSRQFFKSSVGLPEPWCSLRGTALTHSFCQHVVTADAPFVVSDARHDPRVAGNGAIEDLAVVAYAGAPVRGPSGLPIGSLCAIDGEPRDWSDDDLSLLAELADVTSELIGTRAAAAARRAAVLDLSHRLRTGLTALRLEAEELATLAGDDALRAQAVRVVRGLEEQTATLAGALRSAERGSLGPEESVVLRNVLTDVATGARAAAEARGRLVVVADDEAAAEVVRVPRSELTRVLDAVVQVVLEHGRGQVQLGVVADASVLRVRVQDEGAGLPPAVSTALAGRHDAASDSDAVPGLSLAERAARSLGGRLVLTCSRPTTLDLVLPRR
jgi:GAF domain-containing protein